MTYLSDPNHDLVISFKKSMLVTLRIDNGDLGVMWLQWCVFAYILAINYSIWT